MYLVFYFGFTLVPWVSATVVFQGYHEPYGIPAAKKIKDWEDNFFAKIDTNLRIVGGSIAPSNSYPFFAALLIDVIDRRHSVCGSSLLTSNRLVTAAHCWWDGRRQALKFTVVLGTQYLFYGGRRFETTDVVTHPLYDAIIMKNDIAMVYLNQKVVFDASIAPIDLPRGPELNYDFIGKEAVAIGFGKTSDYQITPSAALSHVNLQVMPTGLCQRVILQVTNNNICTSGQNHVGICQGDSGGPLATFLNGRPVLIGISDMVPSVGCELSLPSAYTRITSYYGFIVEHL